MSPSKPRRRTPVPLHRKNTRSSGGRFQDFLTHSFEPMAVFEGDRLATLRLVEFNAPFAALLEAETDAAGEQLLAALIRAARPRQLGGTEDLEAAVAHELRQTFAHGRHRAEWQLGRADGSIFLAEVTLIALPSAGEHTVVATVHDVSEQSAAREALEHSESRFRDLFEVSNDALGFVAPGADGQPVFIDCNVRLCHLYGARNKREILNRPPTDFSPPQQPDGRLSAEYAQAVVERAIEHGHARFEWLARRFDGEVFWMDIALTTRASWGQKVVHFAGRDITERKRLEQALAEAKELAQVTLHAIGDAVITTDAAGTVTFISPIAEALTGWSREEALGRPLAEVFRIVSEHTREPAPDPLTRALREGRVVGLANHTLLLSRSGAEYAIEDSAAPIHLPDGTLAGAVLVFHDVSEARRLAQELSHRARHDMLTGLVNRAEFERCLVELLARSGDGAGHALCFIDLDQFKVVNDSCGHTAGDELLRRVSHLLRAQVRQRDVLGRLGGDEFGLLLENCTPDKACEIAEKLLQALAEFRFRWNDRIFTISASIGVAPIGDAPTSAAELLNQADLACYAAKDQGRNRIHLYRPDDIELAQRHSETRWVLAIRGMLEDSASTPPQEITTPEVRLELYVQHIRPVYPEVAAEWWELLVRLHERDGQLVLPGVFLPTAERYGLMPLLDRWVIKQALALAGRFQQAGRPLRLSVNLSGQSFIDPRLIDELETALREAALTPGTLCLEITELAAVAELDVAEQSIRRLKEAGCLFALDDFGAGLASYAYLKHLPVSHLKIDGSLVRQLEQEPLDRAVVEAINHLGHAVGIRTVAKFVETDELLRRLREIGVDYVQGYAIGTPQPVADLVAELESDAEI